ncbi:MAG: hypothetical protein H7Y08_11625 [Rhizobiaceae bacterium]|nr:hypothetical protein [Rhizobiaceae bacterium]
MKKIIIASVIAAALLPAAAFAQTSDTMTGAGGTMGTAPAATGTMDPAANGTMESGTGAATGTGGAMGAGTASPTSDTTGSYTITTQSSADVAGGSSSDEITNRNTDATSVQNTIDANPGLAEKLEAEGLTLERIAAISVGPNGLVTVYTKS